eukprot:13019809-Ditylum_brightwellii.AAC.2
MLVALHYKLWMFGVPCKSPANLFCDNQGAINNASLPEFTLTKKYNAINFHTVQEAAAVDILFIGKEDGMTNLADLLTKELDSPEILKCKSQGYHVCMVTSFAIINGDYKPKAH